jgi:hypothetical protein
MKRKEHPDEPSIPVDTNKRARVDAQADADFLRTQVVAQVRGMFRQIDELPVVVERLKAIHILEKLAQHASCPICMEPFRHASYLSIPCKAPIPNFYLHVFL